MNGSESCPIQILNSERSNNINNMGTEATLLTNTEMNTVTKLKRPPLPNIEEKLKVKSPQPSMKRKIVKLVDVDGSKHKSSNIISLQGMSYRKDRNGVEIKSVNKRKVKVTFIDKVSEAELVEVVHIESMKEYNISPFGLPEEHYAKTKQCCSCSII